MKQISVTKELASVGLRVVRGKDWVGLEHNFGDQDRKDVIGNVVPHATGIGTITSSPTASGNWVTVKWDSGNSNIYPVGGSSGYALYVYSSLEDTVKASSKVAVTVVNAKVGMTVVRGADWKYGDQDKQSPGGNVLIEARGIGRVTSLDHPYSGWVQVQWDGGYENSYRVGMSLKYDLYMYEPLGDKEEQVKEARKALEGTIVRGTTQEQTKPNKNDHSTGPIKVRRPVSTIKGPNRRVHTPIKG